NPHAVTTISGANNATFTYDANGNMATYGSSSSIPWYSGGGTWGNRRQFVIDHTKMSGTNTFSNFAVLVSISSPYLKASASGGQIQKSGGKDILFTLNNTSKLSHEIEKYAPTTGQLLAWVKIASLSATADTTMYMYFNNSSSADQQDKTGTWNSAFSNVWHL